MKQQNAYFKKLLSVFLAMLMCLSVCVLDWSVLSVQSEAAGTTPNKNYEYYYSSGTKFITQVAIYYSSKSDDDAKSNITKRDYTPIGGNFNAGDGDGDSKYIWLGAKYTTDPTQAITAFSVYNGNSRPNTYSQTLTSNGDSKSYTVTMYKVGSGAAKFVPADMDKVVDLNMSAGGDDLTLYATRDYNAGLPVTDYAQYQNGNPEDGGYTVALNQDGNAQDCNANSGSRPDKLYEGYKSSVTVVNTKTMRSKWNEAKTTYLANSSRYTGDSISDLQTAVDTAYAIIQDYDADGCSCSYTQTSIDNATTAITNAINSLQTTVTLNANGGSGGGTDTVTVGSATSKTYITTKTATRTGYTFKNWSSEKNATSGSTSLQACFMPTYYAAWSANSYTVTLDGNGATTAGTSSVTATYNSAMPAFAKKPERKYRITYTYNGATDGNSTTSANVTYGFNGYYDAKSNGNKYYNADGTSAKKWDKAANTTLYAQWTSETITLPSPTRTGYTFDGWYKDEGFTKKLGAAGATVTLDYNGTAYAKWIKNTYYVQYNGNGNTSGEMSKSTHTYDESQNLSENTYQRQYWTFFGWGKANNKTTADFENKQSVSNLTDIANGTFNLYALWNRKISNTYHYYQADAVTDKTVSKDGTAYNNQTKLGIATPAESEVVTTVTKDDKTWTLKGWKEGTDAIWGKFDQTADVDFGATATVSVTGEKDKAHAFYPVYALSTTKFYANYNYYKDGEVAASVTKSTTVEKDATTGNMPVAYGSDNGAEAEVTKYYSKGDYVYELKGWALTEGATIATIPYTTETTATTILGVPGAGNPTSTANLTPVELHPVYEVYATAIYVDFIFYTDNGVEKIMTVAGRAVGEETTGEVEFPANSQVPATSYVDGDRTYTLVGWSATPDSETYDGFGKKIEVAKLENPTANHHTFYPVYSTETSVQYRYNSVENGVLKTDNYIAKAGATRGGTTANSNTKWSTIPVPTAVDVSAINTYKYQGITYELVGWEKTEAETSTCRTTATFKIGEANTTNEQVTADNAPYIYYPVYKVVKKDLYGQLHYYDANGADKTYEVSTANVTFTAWETGATASGVISFPAVSSISSIVKSYTKNGRTYTLLGWSESANSEMTVSGASRDVTWNNNVKDSYDFYPVYETTTNIKYGYTVMEGTKAVTKYVVKSGVSYGGDLNDCNSKYASIAVPTAADLGSGLTYKKDGLTYELVGWEKVNKGAAGLDVTEVTFELGQDAPTTEQVTADNSDHIYYPVYKIIKKDYVARYHYYDAAGNDKYFEVTTPDIARAATQATVTMPSSSQITNLSYVGKVNGKDVTYTLLGWNRDSTSLNEKSFGTTDTFALPDNTVKIIDYYPVYKFAVTVDYTFYNAEGNLTFTSKNTEAKKANDNIPQFTYVAMPGTDTTPDISLNGRTFSIAGWSTALTSVAPGDDGLSSKKQLKVAVQDEAHNYYGVYSNSSFTLTYNGTMKANSVATNLPDTQYGSQYISAGTGTADIANASEVQFDINFSVIPEKEGYTFIGWDGQNSESQTATYLLANGAQTVSGKENITLYARFSVNKHGVTFTYYDANKLTDGRATTKVKYVYHDDLTRDDSMTNGDYLAKSPYVYEAVGGVTREKIAHIDSNYHYVFDKWVRSDAKPMDEANENITYFKNSVNNSYTFVYYLKNITEDDVLVTAVYTPYIHHYEYMTDAEVVALNGADTKAYLPATCSQDGYHYRSCSVCGYVEKQTLTKLNHIDENGNATTTISGYKAPTCDKTGLYAKAYCTLCGEIVKDDLGNIQYYDLVNDAFVEVTSADGIKPVSEHDWVISEVRPATCKEGGYTLYVCKNNSAHTKKENITDIAPHTPVTIPAVAATCDTAGYTAYQKCSVCGAQINAPQIIAATGHKLEKRSAKAATCTEIGYTATYYYCTVCKCGFSDKPATSANKLSPETIEGYEIPAIGHTLVALQTVAPTCYRPGNTAGIVCEVCGFIPEGSTATTIPMLEHTIQIVKEVPADCTSDGYYEVKCVNEGCDYTGTEPNGEKALGHTEETVEAKAATCAEAGYESYIRCSVCEIELSTKKVIAKLPHTYKVIAEGVAATCLTPGYTTEKQCEKCEFVLASVEIPALGHAYGSWDVSKPTCTEKGSRTCVCTRTGCGMEITQELPALGHDWQDIAAIPVTCTSNGYTAGKTACTRCKAEIVPEEITTQGHQSGAVEYKDSTCYEEGNTAGTKCSVCGQLLDDTAVIKKKEHNWGDAISEAIPATCYQEGKTAYYKCQNEGCTATKGGEVLEKLPHTKGETPLIAAKPATCTEIGYEAIYTCTVAECQAQFGGESIPALGHHWATITEKSEPTCTVDGKEAYYECDREGCTAVKGGEVISALDHDWKLKTDKVEPTCAKVGKEAYYECDREGCTAFKGGEEIAKLTTHTWSTEPTEAKIEPTCAKEGKEAVYACTVEGCTATTGGDKIEKLSIHKWNTVPKEAKVEPTCSKTGKTAVYACTVEGCTKTTGGDEIPVNSDNHTYGDWGEVEGTVSCTTNSTHTRTCTGCKKTETEIVTYATGHSYSKWEVKTKAGCVTSGTMERKCTKCNDKTETYTIPAYGHIAQNVNEVPSTCTKKGNKAGVKCTRCGEYISGGEETEMKSHNFTVTVKGYKATCLVGGLTDTMRCSVCGVLQSEQKVIPAVGKHTEVVTIIYEASTCNHIGHSAEKKCSVCGEILQESKELPLTEHTFKITPAKQATCTTTGMTEGKVCTVCGLVAEKATVIPVQAHTYGDYTITTPSTCTTAGEKVRECTVCHTTQTENLMPNGHHAVFVKAVAVTCTKDGNVAYWTCEFCHGAYEEEALVTPIDNVVITKLGHDFTKPADVASSDIKVATCTEDGYVLCRCKNSGCKEYVKLDKNDLTKLGETDLANLVTAKGHKGGVATCTKKRVCENCNQEYGELLAHTIVEGKVVTHGDCRHRDVLNDYCSVCGKVVKEYYGSFGDHVYNDTSVVEIIPATCTQQGATITHCAIEGCDGYKSEYIATLAHKDADGDGICDMCGNVIPGSDADHLGTCNKCGRNHTSNGGLFGYDGFICKLIAFFRGFKIA